MRPINVDEILMDTRLSTRAKLIWILLSKILAACKNTTFCSIAEIVGCSETESENAVCELVDYGYLDRYVICQDDGFIALCYEIKYITIGNNTVTIVFKIL